MEFDDLYKSFEFDDLYKSFELFRTPTGISVLIEDFERFCDHNSVSYKVQLDGINTSAILIDRDPDTEKFFKYTVTIGTYLLNQVEYFSYRPYEIKDRNRSDTGFFTQHATSISNILKNLNSSSAIKDPILTIAFDKLIELLLYLGNGKPKGKGNRTKETTIAMQKMIISVANDLLSTETNTDYTPRKEAKVNKQLVIDTQEKLSKRGLDRGRTAIRKYLVRFRVQQTFLSSRLNNPPAL